MNVKWAPTRNTKASAHDNSNAERSRNIPVTTKSGDNDDDDGGGSTMNKAHNEATESIYGIRVSVA